MVDGVGIVIRFDDAASTQVTTTVCIAPEMIENILIRSARPADAQQIARIYVDTWCATYQTILPQRYLEGLRYDWTSRSMHRSLMNPQNHFLVAEGAHGTVGYIAGGAERARDPVYRAEVYELYLLPRFQRQGMGKLLLSALAHELYDHHLYTMMVWVLAANPNRRFYERTGGLYLREKSIRVAGRLLDAVAYGWIDSTLAMELPRHPLA